MEKRYKNCQSCGMPLSKDEKNGGTELNGNVSMLYCSHCYENGKFTLPDITVNEMKDRVYNKMIEMKLPKFLARFFVRNINKLERWKNS